MKKPLVSVLIPVYNVEKYLERCLDSIIYQTLTDIEIICVDDGSTDNSAKILKKYAELDNRIIIITKKNGGLPSARNAALDRASGKYIGFVDSDDYVEATMYETLVNAAEKNQSDIVICGANIFPENPKANQWLYDTLSPNYKHYNSFEAEILFDRIDTTPFLWRTLVRKTLIDQEDFRLDEDIIIGEDKAFQCKIYPCAKAITVIPDKLYNYFWCRPESLMSKQVYGKCIQRVKAHIKLVERISDSLFLNITQNQEKENVQKSFLNWSISFIYDDYIYLSEKEKYELTPGLIKAWEKANIIYYKFLLPEWKRDQYEYIKKFEKASLEFPQLSIIVPVEYKTEYVDEWIEQISLIDDKRIEIIIINNGASNESYIKIQKLLFSNKRVRLYNTPEHFSFSQSLNMGINLANGEYISFFEVHDWYKSKKTLLNWLNHALNGDVDLCVSPYGMKKNFADNFCKESIGLYNDIFDLDYHNILYSKKFLIKNQIEFSNASILTGYLFMCKSILNAKKIDKFDECVYFSREMFHLDWISTQKCELVLEGLYELIKLSIEKQNARLHGKVYSILNGNLIKHVIVNNTKPYCMPTQQCPNGENSQIKTVETIFKIIQKADYKLLHEYGFSDDDSILDTLYEIVKERHVFLGNL